MPWKKSSPAEQRLDLVRRMARRKVSLQELCREFKVSRQTAYKWLARYRQARRRRLVIHNIIEFIIIFKN